MRHKNYDYHCNDLQRNIQQYTEKMKLPGQGFQKLEHEHGRHTLRRDRTHYHAAFVGGKNASGLNVKESRLISTKQKIDKCMRV